MLELTDIKLFIKKNSNVINLTINYTDEGDIYNYKINIEGINYEIKIIDTYENISIEYNNEIYRDDNEIQLKLFELFNYKNIEYLDCYINNKINKINDYYYYDNYNDDYDNQKDILVCNRIIKNKDNKLIKFKFEYYKNEYYLIINDENIIGFDNIIKKIDSILC